MAQCRPMLMLLGTVEACPALLDTIRGVTGCIPALLDTMQPMTGVTRHHGGLPCVTRHHEGV